MQEYGEGHLLVFSENADPNTSEPNADNAEVGDWVSFARADRFGDGDLSDAFECPLNESAKLRGYGCNGFLFGRGGGMSIGFMKLSALPSDSRTT